MAKQKYNMRLKKFLAAFGLAGMLTLSFSGCGKMIDMMGHVPRDMLPDDIVQYGIIVHGDNLEELKELVNDGMDVNTRILDQSTLTKVSPLYLTMKEDYKPDFAEYLLEQGADPNFVASKGQTLLMIASGALNTNRNRTFTDVDCVKLLVKNGSDIETKSDEGLTALDYAVRDRATDIIAYLLKNGAEITQKTLALVHQDEQGIAYYVPAAVKLIFEAAKEQGVRYEEDPLLEAAVLGDSETVIALIDDWGSDEYSAYIPFYVASYCNADAIKHFEERGFDMASLNENGSGLLSLAAANGNAETVRYLAERGAEINVRREHDYTESPLASAIAFNHYEIASYLLSAGAQFYIPADNNWLWYSWGNPISDLDCAVVSGNPEMITLLEDYAYPFNNDNVFTASAKAMEVDNLYFLEIFFNMGFDPNYGNGLETLLSDACLYGNFDAVKILDECGANMNDGHAFETACKEGYFEIVQYMTERSMDTESLVFGLSQSVFYGRFDIIEFLVEEGTEINADCLISAAYSNYRTLKYLLDHGANVDGCDRKGNSALMYATRGQKIKNMKALLDAGADTSLKNNDGQTAYDIAKETNNKAIIKLLEKKQK